MIHFQDALLVNIQTLMAPLSVSAACTTCLPTQYLVAPCQEKVDTVCRNCTDRFGAACQSCTVNSCSVCTTGYAVNEAGGCSGMLKFNKSGIITILYRLRVGAAKQMPPRYVQPSSRVWGDAKCASCALKSTNPLCRENLYDHVGRQYGLRDVQRGWPATPCTVQRCVQCRNI